MKFWEILFWLIHWPMLPKERVTYNLNFEMGKVDVIYVRIMPWAKAMAIGSTIYTTHKRHKFETDHNHIFYHECEHVRQWVSYGFWFPIIYLRESLKALFRSGRPYKDNVLETYAKDMEDYHRQRGNPRFWQ